MWITSKPVNGPEEVGCKSSKGRRDLYEERITECYLTGIPNYSSVRK